MGTLTDLLSVLRRERAHLFAKYGLKSMAVFGSATRDERMFLEQEQIGTA